MSTESTPGPWAWQRFGKEWCLVGQWGMRPIVLSVMRKVGLTSLVDGLLVPLNPEHPDARLIAAAPDLLEALIGLMSSTGALNGFHGTDNPAEAKARAAIAKAEGR